jgi:hypothetical protein
VTGAPQLPPNALNEARELLHEVLVGVVTAVGWSKGRADAYPPATVKVPSSWVDAPTLSAQGNGLVATFPIGLAVDGTERAQVERLDAFIAMLWTRLEAVRIPDTAELLPKGSTLQVMTAGPEQLDVGGPSTRALALTVQVPIGPRTLCPTALTGDPTP